MTQSSRRRLCCLLPVVALLTAATPAWAATRYASPSSSVTSGGCPQANPCTATAAVMGAATGDEVILDPGTYSLATALHPHPGVSIHGADGQVPPALTFGASTPGNALTLTDGSSLRHAVIQMLGSGGSTLVLQGARGDDLLLYESASGTSAPDHPHAAADLIPSAGASVLADSVADATGSGTTAVEATGGHDGARVALSNVTAVAQAAGSTAVASAMSSGTLTLTDVIARGAWADLATVDGVDHPVAATVSYSNLRPQQSSGYVDGGHNQQAQPLFANPGAGDFHEAAGSPTIDAGTVAADSGPVDPDGSSRFLGLAPDIGGYEYNAMLAGGGTAGSSGGGAGGGSGSGLGGLGTTGQGTAGGAGGGAGASSGGAIFATGTQTLPPPQAGKTFVAHVVSGTVLVEVAHQHQFVPLGDRALLPFGSKVDTRAGRVQIIAARDLAGDPESAQFFSGLFGIAQRRPVTARGRPTVLLTLTGGELAGCPRLPNGRKASVATDPVALPARRRRPRHRHRSLWGVDSGGNFSTHGNNSVAAVRGTKWLTEDYCSGTLTRVVRGRVLVHDLATGRHVLLTAGQHYFADLRRAPRLRRR